MVFTLGFAVRMKMSVWKTCACAAVLLTGCHAPRESTRGAVQTGQFRDLFAEAGHPRAESSARINAAYRQLFHGDPSTQAVYFVMGANDHGPLAEIRDIGHNDVRSEGMSYGMMILVQLDKQAEFNALWNWAKTYMYHPSPKDPSFGFFSWSMQTNGVVNDDMPAPDGEQYFAMALYFASGRWGNGPGIYDYRAQADQLLTHLLHRELITGPTLVGTKTAGPLFDPATHLVRFTPDVKNWNHTDPSYQLPAFYELWARWGPAEDRSFWADAAVASRDFLNRSANPVTALAPDYANFDGTPWKAPWNSGSTIFQYDSPRNAMNWSVDWSWWAEDPRECARSDRLQAFFESKGMTNYVSQFTLDGKDIGGDHTTALVAMNATASLAATRPRAREFVEALWNTKVPTGEWRYYDGMLQLLALLHCSGQFRVWTPR